MSSAADGLIIILSYPETFVRPAYTEFSSKIWPKIGIGGKHAVQAGHAALLLIKKNYSEILYYDFGRYITSFGMGRVRSKETDVELKIPITAKFENSELKNLEEILLWIEKHPEKTHGDGKLVASVNNEINFTKAQLYIKKLINEKEIMYGAFTKKGTNCARFVTDTIIKSTINKKVEKRLKISNLFTPSPLGNVIKGNTTNIIFQIENQQIKDYKNRSILKSYTSFLEKQKIDLNTLGTENPNKKLFYLNDGTWLGGIGSGAWFKIEEQISDTKYKIARYTVYGIKDFEANFCINNTSFNFKKPYHFIHPSNCLQVKIQQNEKIYHLNIKN